MSYISNVPKTLAYVGLEATHVLACPKRPLTKLLQTHASMARFFTAIRDNAPNACCRSEANHDVEAWYSSEHDRVKGIPDIYKFYCRECNRCHVRFCVGGSFDPATKAVTHPRPFWEVR